MTTGTAAPAALEWDMGAYRRRAGAFGRAAVVIDGHGSGTPDELAEAAGISASRIAAVARDLLKGDA